MPLRGTITCLEGNVKPLDEILHMAKRWPSVATDLISLPSVSIDIPLR